MIKIDYCRHSGNQGTTGRPARARYIVEEISLRTRRSKPGEAPVPGEVSTEISLERGPREGLGEASGLAKAFASPRALCLCDRVHMGSASAAESQTRQSAMVTALLLPFSHIKQSTKQRQAKKVQDLPLW